MAYMLLALYVSVSDVDAPASSGSIFEILEEEAALTLVSAGRRERDRNELAENITVITAEEIRRSGVTFLPELLRRYAGIVVSQRTPTDWNVSLRGDLSLGTNGDAINAALYAQDEWALGDRLFLTAGLRGETYVYPTAPGVGPFWLVSPKASAVFLLDKAQSLRLQLSRGVRAPSAADLFGRYNPPNYLAGNAAARIEDAWNLELGYLLSHSQVSAQAAVFATSLSGLRQTDDAAITSIVSQGRALGLGGELEATWRPVTGLKLHGNFSLRRYFTPRSRRLSRRPRAEPVRQMPHNFRCATPTTRRRTTNHRQHAQRNRPNDLCIGRFGSGVASAIS